jgi:hypothetical protein
MMWITLTDPEGNNVLLNGDQVVLVRIPAAGEFNGRARSVIDLSNGHLQAVRETPDEAFARLQAKR